MPSVRLRLGASIAALALVAGCASNKAEQEALAQAQAAQVAAAEQAAILARQPPPIALNDSVAQSAAIYVAFTRDIATLRGGFANSDEIEAALQRGAAYDPIQMSRGLIAYASILALQSPEFVAGVRQLASDRAARDRAVAAIVANPAYAGTLPGADAAAGLIIGVLEGDIRALADSADSIESDAYAIQADGRQSWARAALPNRDGRLQDVKDRSARSMQANAQESSRLLNAAYAGSGLGVSTPRLRQGPYPTAVTNGLAIAALAALNGAGDNARANTDALQYDRAGQDCLQSSKLNLFQCLAASRPSYEDMFCLGRHVVRDLGTCARGSALPAAIITVGAPVSTTAPAPSVTPAPFSVPEPQTTPVAPDSAAPDSRYTPVPSSPPTQTPVQTPAPRVTPQPQSGASPTQRLNGAPPSAQAGPNS